jgi:hypothetical protein
LPASLPPRLELSAASAAKRAFLRLPTASTRSRRSGLRRARTLLARGAALGADKKCTAPKDRIYAQMLSDATTRRSARMDVGDGLEAKISSYAALPERLL